MTIKPPICIRVRKTAKVFYLRCHPERGFQAILRDIDGNWLMPNDVGEIEVVGAEQARSALRIFDQSSRNGLSAVSLDFPDFCLVGVEAALSAAGYEVVKHAPPCEEMDAEGSEDDLRDSAVKKPGEGTALCEKDHCRSLDEVGVYDDDVDEDDMEMVRQMRIKKLQRIRRDPPQLGIELLAERIRGIGSDESEDEDGYFISASPEILYTGTFDAVQAVFPRGECPLIVARTLRKFAEMLESEAGEYLANLRSTRWGEDEAYRMPDGSVRVRPANRMDSKAHLPLPDRAST